MGMATISAASVAERSVPSLRDLGYTADPVQPVTREFDEALEVAGRLPDGLTGTLYRNGPARWAEGRVVHAFDGDGMICQLVFDGSSIRYRNRYVRTPNYRAGAQGSGRQLRGLGTQRPGGVLANALRPPSDRANTNAVVHADRLLALADGGRPWELDLDTLETLGRCDFDGRLPWLSSFSPHPKIDPHTGELFNFGHAAVRPRQVRSRLPYGLRCYRLSPTGRMDTVGTVPLDRSYLNHDFAITGRYLVFVLTPLVLNVRRAARAALGLEPYERAVEFHDELGTRIVLVPRAGGPARIVECPTIPYVHLNNAFDDRGDVVADLVRYDNFQTFLDAVRNVKELSFIPAGSLVRLRVTAGDRVEAEGLCDELGEFPQHDWRRTGQPYRYSYYSGYNIGPSAPTAAVFKVDNETGIHRTHLLPRGAGAGEPILVPRRADAAEDEGWLLCLVALCDEERTAVYILDSRDLETDPLAVARLPHYVFPGFHGAFTRRISRWERP